MACGAAGGRGAVYLHKAVATAKAVECDRIRWRHTIRNCIFWHQSLEISYFWLRIQDSGHFQPAIYTVFDEESESAVRIDQILHPEEKIKKNRPMRVSISYRKISYYTSPPYRSNPCEHDCVNALQNGFVQRFVDEHDMVCGPCRPASPALEGRQTDRQTDRQKLMSS